MFNKFNMKNTIFLFLLSISCLFSVSSQAKTPEEQAQDVINSSKDVDLFLDYYRRKGFDFDKKILVSGLTINVIPRSKLVLERKYTDGDIFFRTAEIKLPSKSYGMPLSSYDEHDFIIILDQGGSLTHLNFKPKESEEISNLHNYKKLYGLSINNSDISLLDLSKIGFVKELEIFNSSSRNIILPEDSSIESLAITRTPVEVIRNLGELHNIDILKIRDSKLTSLSELTNSDKLRRFVFKNDDDSEPTKLPDFSLMPNLEFLHFFSDEVVGVSGIEKLKKLKVLFTSLEFDYSDVKFPKSLEYLHTGGEVNDKLPNLRGNINLKEIVISGTNSSEISGLDDLINLKLLVLSRSKIKKISGLENLTNLEEISLYGNEITKVEGLENLGNIKFIKLDKNKITKVEGLKNLSGVKGISFEHNPIETLDFSEIEHLKNTKVLMWYTPFWKTATKEDKRKLDNLARKGHL